MKKQFIKHALSELEGIMIQKISSSSIHCGFPSPATDYISERINLSQELIPNPDYTELVEVTWGDCCKDEQVFKGCLVLIDYTLEPKKGDLVYVRDGDDDMIRVYRENRGRVSLTAANREASYSPIFVDPGSPVEIRGVITFSIVPKRKRNVL